MITNDLIRTAARVEYRLLRTPLTVLDKRVVSRLLDADSPVRRTFENGLESLDDAFDRLLHGAPPAGSATERDDESRTAPGDDATEASAPDQLTAEDQNEADALARELLDMERDKVYSGELADEELRRVQAEIKAKQMVEDEAAGHRTD